ncbi:MAG: 4-hydroxy-3-methylbut-2-enyl diphosphate reductase, partial [Proteobacteria bacterium]|nr:4-hydroxy-3-methylbut-2-enyl diphosphate reductase [Pseudomonadota bacterium]
MKILLAKTAGFCMGVRRAVEMALDAPNKHENPIYTYGPLIHNPHVLDLLKEKGISVIDDIPDHGSGTVLIRAHGVPPQAKEKLKKAGFTIIDATCPRVIMVQTIIKKHARQGYTSIIIGDNDHPEVVGLLGCSDGKGYVIDNINGLDSLPAFEKAIIVAQTTQNTQFFEEVKKWADKKFPHYKIFNTICDSTSKRQAEVKHLARSVGAVIVVGGHNSGNTRRLAEIAKESGKPSYHIESEDELDLKALASAQNIGLTAGASTPNWIIKRVYRTLESLFLKKERGWRKAFFSIQRSLLLTNIYVSLGAGCLCYACTRLQGIEHYFPHVLISILYVLSMHILN